jgi:hypothetical protein
MPPAAQAIMFSERPQPYTSLNATFFCDASIAACAAASRATGILYGEHDT